MHPDQRGHLCEAGAAGEEAGGSRWSEPSKTIIDLRIRIVDSAQLSLPTSYTELSVLSSRNITTASSASRQKSMFILSLPLIPSETANS